MRAQNNTNWLQLNSQFESIAQKKYLGEIEYSKNIYIIIAEA